MTMLTHTGSPFKAAPHTLGKRDTVDAGANAHLATIKRFCICTLAALLAGSAVAGIIALRTAVYFWRLHY